LLGIFLDPAATATAAYQHGRDSGNSIEAMLGRVDVALVLNVDATLMQTGLSELASMFEMPAVNAGVRLVNGQVEATPPVNGRTLDINGTLALLQQDAGAALADGEVELVMSTVQPAVTDASSMVAQATQLLSGFLDFRVYDPMTDDTVYWSLSPEQWGKTKRLSPFSVRLPMGAPKPLCVYITMTDSIPCRRAKPLSASPGTTACPIPGYRGRTRV
jgi:hypothetical protein